MPKTEGPLVHTPEIIKIFPGARREQIPLFTSGIGKFTAIALSGTVGFGTEALRGIRDRLINYAFQTNLAPEVSAVNTEGFQVTLTVPVTQLVSPGTSEERVAQATEGLITAGQYHLVPKLPPAYTIDGQSPPTIPTPSFRKPFSQAEPDTPLRQMIIKARSRDLHRLNKAWPIGTIQISAPQAITESLIIRRTGLIKTDQPEFSELIPPDIRIGLLLHHVTSKGDIVNKGIRFRLGEQPIQFNLEGSVRKPPTMIGTRYLHPALMSLEDFASIASTLSEQETGGQARIEPDEISQALILAANADEDTRPYIEPHIKRMKAIGAINTLLGARPGEFSIALGNMINFVTASGELHSADKDIKLAIINSILGFDQTNQTDYGHPTNYIALISKINQLVQSQETGAAFIQYTGNSHLVQLIADKAREVPALEEFATQMGVDLNDLNRVYRKGMSVGEFFSCHLTPSAILLQAFVVLGVEKTQALIQITESRMILRRMNALQTILQHVDAEDQRRIQRLIVSFEQQLKKDGGNGEITLAARRIIEAIDKKYQPFTPTSSEA